MLNVELKRVPDISFAVEGSMNCVGKELPPGMSAEEYVEYLLKRLKDGHEGVLEHIIYQFKITDLSRAALQELVRHRIASFLVLSTRWALKKKLSVELPVQDTFYHTGDRVVDTASFLQLCEIRRMVGANDVIKYALPDSFYTDVYMTINGRSLRNFFKLRKSINALKEMRELAKSMLNQIPTFQRPLFDEFII